MNKDKNLVLEAYRVLTALVLSSDRTCEEAVEGLHQDIALELANSYMLEHGYGIDVNGNFVEQQETLIF